jgi:predicted nucleic acid-binding protein
VGAVVVVDSGVVIGLLDGSDAHHSAARGALADHRDDDLRIPSSAYAEAIVRPAREGRIDEVRRDLHALGLAVDAIPEPSAAAAARLRARHGLRLPDALVLGHAEAIDADVILTTDARWRRISTKVRVVG